MNTFFYNIHNLFIYLSFFLLLFPSANSISFQRTRFEPTDTTIIYEGGATPFVGAIELNNDAYQCQVGRATYTEKILLWDSHTQKLSDFSTSFSSTVDIQRRPIYGSGFTFFLAPLESQILVNSAGGFLGLYNITTQKSSSRSQIVHIEFDSQPDSEWDPPFEHVGININSLSSVVHTPWNVTLHSSDTIDVWISYNGSTKNLTVSWKFRLTAISQEITSLSYIIDLREVLPQWVKIGFSAATRDYIERHAVYSWEFSSSLEEESKQSNYKKIASLILIIVVMAIVIIGLVVIATGVWWGRKLRGGETEKMNLNSIIKDLENGAGLQRFSYNDLDSATRNFSNESKLGEGESATTVYKGSLANLNTAVAVRKFECGSRKGKKKYINELKIISQLKHPNLVELIGCCHEKGKFLLVYKFISNGNLESHLFGKKTPLTWSVRYKIVLELASVLLYLHEEWEQCVGHVNIKSSNIILDSNFKVKICDFGLAQLMDHELGSQTRAIDVYGFGLIALEIATGRKILDPIEEQPHMSLVDLWDLYRNETLNLAIDKKLNNVFDDKQMKCLMIVGLWCAHPDESLRPSIRQAIHVLNFHSVLPKLCISGQ